MTFTSELRKSNARRVSHVVDMWDDVHKPALDRIEQAACDFLHALNMAREDLWNAKDITSVDALCCDLGGQTLDLLADLIGTQKKEISDAKGDPDVLHLDTEELEEQHRISEARWSARK